MKSLIVIPVRGGSLGIPDKALRPLGGIPPLARTITTALDVAPDVVVVTDADAVADLARQSGAQVFREPPSSGQRTVDRAVWQVVQAFDHRMIATVQCTSPFLTAATIARCLELAGTACHATVTVRDDRHVAWRGPAHDPILATPWTIRQELPARWVITGGCVASRRTYMSEDRRFGGKLRLVPVTGAEAIDLDAPADWALAEWYAGAVTSREILMAKVLGEAPGWVGVVVRLSAWGESPEEFAYRAGQVVTAGRQMVVRGAHTAEEARLAIDALLPEETSVTVVTSAYHQVRAFLTFLKVLQVRGLERTIRLYNAPAPSRMDKLADEWRKIREYREDVADVDEGLAYLQWRDAVVTV